jgi:crossover junction endodeoxyribonuclease RuvC
MIIIGIDPGLSGAIVSIDTVNPLENIVHDIPTFTVTVKDGQRRKIDIHKLQQILKNEKADHVYLENVHAMPKQGVASMFSMGVNLGVIEASIVAAGLPYTTVPAMVWKKVMQCPKDKDAARRRASQLLPAMAHNWDLKKHDGRAEAAIIALYGLRISQVLMQNTENIG